MKPNLARREFLGAGASAIAYLHMPRSLFAFEAGDKPIPFLDAQAPVADKPILLWDELTTWITPQNQFFSVGHYNTPEVAMDTWNLPVTGLVNNPKTLTLAQLKARPKREYDATLECSGNGAFPQFVGGIGNARWGGAALGPLLKECGLKPEAIEVVFYAADAGKEKIRDKEYPQHFARSLSLSDAMADNVFLAYEMNGEPLPKGHGAPLRLIVPGWYGIAWAKWVTRIEVTDRRFMSKFMARDYVTIRGEQQGDQTIWRETSVSKLNLKSIVARVVQRPDGTLRVSGAAWNDGTEIKSVELKVDDGSWMQAKLGEGRDKHHAWTFWSVDWKGAQPGEHTLVSRATDARGTVQPTAEDPQIALKRTYWEANQQFPRKIKI